MKISYNWLKQFLSIDWEAEKTGDLLTDLGLEIEGISNYQSVKGGLQGVVVGHVLSCEKHTNADKLKVTSVDIGQQEPLQIVCGAPNVATGQKVAVATIGTTLYDAQGEPWSIKKGKIRSVESFGMLCGADELGLGHSEGIMVLDQELAPGTPCASVFEIENDQVFEIGLTPNRADAMSHFGVARDLKAGFLQQEGTSLELISPSVSTFKIDNRTKKIDIEVQDKELAPRYCGVTISGVKVEDSPSWLQNRLKAIGLAPINNIVDVTNYVLHELGQPLHAFDTTKIAGNKIEVKTVAKDTLFTTLDGVERKLHPEDLMICDIEKPLCIAGVFGGLDSGVSPHTTSIFLESAYFNPVSVRKTAKRHGLNTDASFRFERGIDPNITKYALKRAALLIQQVAGGEITSDVEDIYPKKIEDFQVFLTFKKVNDLIGQEIPRETIKSILSSLEMKVNNITETGIGLTIPSYRVDVQREADVIEEILRVYGYNNISFSQKLNASISYSSKFEDHKLQNIIGNQLVSQGFYEIMTNSLTNPKYVDLTEDLKQEHNIAILNPLSKELSAMRQSILFSGLESVAYNCNRKRTDIAFFEFGKTYHQYTQREEHKHLGLFISGQKTPESWNLKQHPTNFFYAKGIIIAILKRLGITKLKSSSSNASIFSEAITLSYAKKKLVTFGVVKNAIVKHFDIKQQVIFADFNWDAVLEVAAFNKVKFSEITKFPEVRRDFALLLEEHITFAEIEQIAKQSEKKLLKQVNLFDVYQGDNLPKGKKSYAVSFILQDEKQTLTEKQIDKIMTKLQASFEKQLQAELR